MPLLRGTFGASGPIIDVLIGESEPRQAAERAAGRQPKTPLRLQFIVDTGAGMTLVNDQHMRSLQIPVSGAAQLVTALSVAGSTTCETYDVSLRIGPPDEDGFRLPIVEVVGRPFFHGVDGLLGRDILRHMNFTVIGPERKYILEWPSG